MTARGHFIVFEGIDRSGKTTQSKLLFQKLLSEDREMCWMRFPNYNNPIGAIIQRYLRKEIVLCASAAQLLFAANRRESVDLIEQQLERGVNIVCDRYSFSAVAYGTALDLPIEWCAMLELNLPKPDLVIYIDLSAEEAMARKQVGLDDLYENVTFLTKVREAYPRALHEFCGLVWQIYNGSVSQEALTDQIYSGVMRIIQDYPSHQAKLELN